MPEAASTHGEHGSPFHQRSRPLTVDHLEGAAVAGEPRRELVASGDHISREGAVNHSLVRLCGSAGGIHEVSSLVLGIDGAGVAVVSRAVERVHVEAALSHGAALRVRQFVRVAQEELQVALWAVANESRIRCTVVLDELTKARIDSFCDNRQAAPTVRKLAMERPQ